MKPSFFKDPVGLSLWEHLDRCCDEGRPISMSRIVQELFGGIDSYASREFWTHLLTRLNHNDERILFACFLIAMSPAERLDLVDYYFGGSEARIRNNRSAS
jgi:hypothetical protein